MFEQDVDFDEDIVRLGDTDLLALAEPELRELRWKRFSMVFQSAMDALNPVITIGEQMIDTLRAHSAVDARQARERQRAPGPARFQAAQSRAGRGEMRGASGGRDRGVKKLR